MAQTVTKTATDTDETTVCRYCPEVIHLDDDAFRDSDGQRCCPLCYADGTAYVEALDLELDSGAGW